MADVNQLAHAIVQEATEPRHMESDEFVRFLQQRLQDAFGMTIDEFVAAIQDGTLDRESPRVDRFAILIGA